MIFTVYSKSDGKNFKHEPLNGNIVSFYRLDKK